MRVLRLLIILNLWALNTSFAASPELKALIVDGQNNHGMWPKVTAMMKHYLEDTGLFTVHVERTRFTWQGAQYIDQYPLASGEETTPTRQPIPDLEFAPNFSDYDVVINNNGWRAQAWSDSTRKSFEDYIHQGGGLVIIHAADNSWPDWKAYNEMIGLGGWGDRTEKDGPYVYYNDSGELIRDTSPGRGGSHGPQHEFLITIRNSTHPITQGMPKDWLHAKDELYDRLRGPGINMQVLATAYSSKDKRGTGRHEPMLLTLNYGQGRIFHTPMGHADYSAECVGFIISLQRGTEWAATGKVTQTTIPSDFPTAKASKSRSFE